MSKVKIAVAGISRRTGWAIPALKKYENDVEIVGLCDIYKEKCEWAKKHYELSPATTTHDDINDLLKNCDCDAVMVMSSDSNHAELAVPALNAGKKIFCEKPLETTFEKCQQIVEADEKAGGNTFVGFNLRYSPVYSKVKEIVTSGEIGRILTVQADEFYGGGRTYFRRWNRWREKGGGLWITKASHDFDIMTWLIGGEKPLSVYAAAERSYYVPKPEAGKQCRDCPISGTCPDYVDFEKATATAKEAEKLGGEPSDLCLYNSGSDTFDHGISTITYENDIFATYTCNVVAGFSNRRIRISGTKGTIDGSLCSKSIEILHRDSFRGKEAIELNMSLDEGHGGADDHVISNFIDFIKGKAEPKCRPREATVPIAMGLAATKSYDTNSVVKISDIM